MEDNFTDRFFVFVFVMLIGLAAFAADKNDLLPKPDEKLALEYENMQLKQAVRQLRYESIQQTMRNLESEFNADQPKMAEILTKIFKAAKLSEKEYSYNPEQRIFVKNAPVQVPAAAAPKPAPPAPAPPKESNPPVEKK